MRNMKKFVAALLVLTMVAALASTAFAYNVVAADKYVQFTGSAWGYGKVTNDYGKSRSGVALRKGSIAHVVATKGKWIQVEIPARGLKTAPELIWFNGDYTKDVNATSTCLLFSSGGSGRSAVDPNGQSGTFAAMWKKVTVKSGRRTNIRKTPSLAGKSLGVVGKGHGTKTLKLAKDHRWVTDSRGVPFVHIIYKGKEAWVSIVYLDKIKV